MLLLYINSTKFDFNITIPWKNTICIFN